MYHLFLALVTSATILYYAVGTSFAVKADGVYDYTITMKSGSIHANILITTFTLDNRSAEGLAVGRFNFDAFDDKGNLLTWVECGTPFEGIAPAHTKVEGNACWSNIANDASRVFVEYHHSAFWTYSGTWYVNR